MSADGYLPDGVSHRMVDEAAPDTYDDHEEAHSAPYNAPQGHDYRRIGAAQGGEDEAPF